MRIDPIQIQPNQKIVKDYRHDFTAVEDKFDYPPFEKDTWINRWNDLQEREFKREELARVLHRMNDQWQAPSSAFHSIERLKDSQSTVIIAGQQAGLLTGPLYTVHKVISILQLAKQKEEELNKPVIPVFWIAGEDHDFDEINHVMLKSEKRMKKHAIHQEPEHKSSVSDLEIDKDQGMAWLNEIFSTVKETEITQSFYERTLKALQESASYTDFFAKLIYMLFPEEGLVLVDAHRPELRQLESGYFQSMLDHNREISQGVYAAIQKNKQQGYSVSLDSDITDAHLFYHDGGDRILLTRTDDHHYQGKNNEVFFTEEQIKEIAENSPEKLSNNVVTRPLMQESVFPVLGFIGGPGEVSYWSVLKPAFQAFGFRMPPVLPRLSFTLIDRKSEQTMSRLQMEPQRSVQSGTREMKMNWLASVSSPPIEKLSEEVKAEIDKIHKPLRAKAAELGADLGALAETNLHHLYKDVQFLEQRMTRRLEEKYKKEIACFNELDLLMHPEEGLQERVWSILPWVNEYGMDVFAKMNHHHLSFEHPHYLVFI
ncbi:bacillithiol biosynthesis cysteine-adding enzyme BshC [Halobacillus rhizosphaerae]|uniref:bacillithiol biosynthesis cysteine-adding enzyme BshC n=1 Tax=Halobacillus rhizosphaerae TaxID=3064889 RepID=UPI00398B2C6E